MRMYTITVGLHYFILFSLSYTIIIPIYLLFIGLEYDSKLDIVSFLLFSSSFTVFTCHSRLTQVARSAPASSMS